MNHELRKSDLGLLANGSFERWDVSIDESPNNHGWTLEIQGPQTYLTLQFDDMTVISKAVSFLDATLQQSAVPSKWTEKRDVVALGRFGKTSVSLVRDNEGFPRCFIVLGRRAQSTMHMTIDEADIRSLLHALRQVEEDIGEGPSTK